ncbi:NHP2-like protein 1 [Armadillidium nasatum]|uniref:NHP2-like protein 1 n=1 Tax=Armadillidium nasatum TaxID=96803 RepID=A0A5N5T934_9CRUS|nr:NHP2-like protein 1 [Armadillidium nasatum]
MALRRGLAELIIIAANAEPLEIALHLPLLCVDKNVRYVFVRSKTALGRACNIRRKVIACAIVKKIRSPLVQQINTLQSEIEKFCGSRI